MANISVDADIDVDDFFCEMNEKEMAELLKLDISDFDLSQIQEDKQAFYKEFAYQVGNSDSENLEYLISKLQYWSKK